MLALKYTTHILQESIVCQSLITPSRERIPKTDLAVSLSHCSLTWAAQDEANPRRHLEDISLKVKKGELVAIVGRVGAGKSSLLRALLGIFFRLQTTTLRRDGEAGWRPQSEGPNWSRPPGTVDSEQESAEKHPLRATHGRGFL